MKNYIVLLISGPVLGYIYTDDKGKYGSNDILPEQREPVKDSEAGIGVWAPAS